MDLPTTSPAIEPRTVVVAFVIGLGVTSVAATLPAWSAARVAPMEALRDVVPATVAAGRLRHTLGWLVTAAGAAMLAACALVGNQRWWTLVATLTTFIGIVVVGPSMARGLARLAGHGRPGRQLASRGPQRRPQLATCRRHGLGAHDRADADHYVELALRSLSEDHR